MALNNLWLHSFKKRNQNEDEGSDIALPFLSINASLAGAALLMSG